MRYFIELSYKGTNYHGWQMQPNGLSIQQLMENALSLIFQIQVPITGAGRTDAGVHAKHYFAHFDLPNAIPTTDLPLLIYKLNSLISKEVVIHQIYEVQETAHARFDAIARTYQYLISTQKDPFLIDLAWIRKGDLNLDLMNQASNILLEYNDFTSFSKLHSQTKTNLCHLMHAHWQQVDDLITFEIKADRFLRNMVRAIVGTLVDVGRKKINLQEFRNIIEAKNRERAGFSAPAQGLYLVKIEYPFQLV
jgi:tRNA pseudouridine38-40 synthase